LISRGRRRCRCRRGFSPSVSERRHRPTERARKRVFGNVNSTALSATSATTGAFQQREPCGSFFKRVQKVVGRAERCPRCTATTTGLSVRCVLPLAALHCGDQQYNPVQLIVLGGSFHSATKVLGKRIGFPLAISASMAVPGHAGGGPVSDVIPLKNRGLNRYAATFTTTGGESAGKKEPVDSLASV